MAAVRGGTAIALSLSFGWAWLADAEHAGSQLGISEEEHLRSRGAVDGHATAVPAAHRGGGADTPSVDFSEWVAAASRPDAIALGHVAEDAAAVTDARGDACDAVCEMDDRSASCQERVAWAKDHLFAMDSRSCEKAHDLVKSQCATCSGCPLDVACPPSADPETSQDRTLTAPISQAAADAPTALATPMSPNGSEEPFDCFEGLVSLKSDWPSDKKSWCCLHHSLGCEEASGGPLPAEEDGDWTARRRSTAASTSTTAAITTTATTAPEPRSTSISTSAPRSQSTAAAANSTRRPSPSATKASTTPPQSRPGATANATNSTTAANRADANSTTRPLSSPTTTSKSVLQSRQSDANASVTRRPLPSTNSSSATNSSSRRRSRRSGSSSGAASREQSSAGKSASAGSGGAALKAGRGGVAAAGRQRGSSKQRKSSRRRGGSSKQRGGGASSAESRGAGSTRSSRAAASSLAPTTSSALFDCEASGGRWWNWTVQQAVWCCETQGVGCPPTATLTTTSPEAAASYDCAWSASWLQSWSVAQRSWCCELQGHGCADGGQEAADTALEGAYDCEDQTDLWSSWSLRKAEWCCRHRPAVGPWCRGIQPAQAEEREAHAEDNDTVMPYNCQRRFFDWKRSWSRQKVLWCCFFGEDVVRKQLSADFGCPLHGALLKRERLAEDAVEASAELPEPLKRGLNVEDAIEASAALPGRRQWPSGHGRRSGWAELASPAMALLLAALSMTASVLVARRACGGASGRHDGYQPLSVIVTMQQDGAE